MSFESSEKKERTGLSPGKLYDRFTYGFLVLAGISSFLMAIGITYAVVRRYFFRSPDDNIYLVIYLLMLCCAMFSFAHTQKMGRHITVDAVSSRFSPLVRGIILNIIGPLMGLFFCGCIVWMSWNNAIFAMNSGETTFLNPDVNVWPFKMIVPLGAGLMCLVLIVQIIRYVFSLRYKTIKTD